MYSARESCCTQHFDYDYWTYMKTKLCDYTSIYFYPDWTGTNGICIDDVKIRCVGSVL